MEDKRFAVLIDSENISAKYIGYILDEVTKYGGITYKRIYGDWTNNQTGKWKNVLMEYSLMPVQQFRNTVGKNSSDSALIIDAMDILYGGDVDGFCIVSSDSDFTRLASRLRESGKQVIGMGESKTPRSFRAACSVFTNLELLIEQEEERPAEETAAGVVPRSTIENDIAAIIAENDDRARHTGLSEIGNRLVKRYSDFDVRNYGYSTLSKFVGEMERFTTVADEKGAIIVKLRNSDGRLASIENHIRKTVGEAGRGGIELGLLGQGIYHSFDGFRAKDFGYNTFAKFIRSISGIEIIRGKDNSQTVRLRNDK
ncbi:MAG: NYN domain-containing protein [Clostridia bacterium]|nr:NYN domain-containing protein [Clostridia bacterium]MBQ9966540.1 NYN domain-containing protein [Clostridia bacterium]